MGYERFYGTDYLECLTNEITAAHDCVDPLDYSTNISGVTVGSSREGLKSDGISAGQNAFSHVNDIRDKFTILQTALNTFYGEADETSSNILALAGKLNELMSEANSSLVKICDMLNGVGDYKGVCITADIITSAGIDKTKFAEVSNDYWVLVIDTDFDADNLNDTAVEAYVDYLQDRVANGEKLSEEDLERLNKIYEYYVAHRFGDTGDVRDMPMQTINNCIDVYELINPDAKYTMDVFFADSIAQDDEVMNRNMARIRYATYTADPEYRDIILHYMPYLDLASYDHDGTAFYNGYMNHLKVNLLKDYDGKDASGNYIENSPFGAFFHEFGHGIDDVTDLFGDSSNGMHDMLADELRNHMNGALNKVGSMPISAADKALIASLSEEERQEVINEIISYHNSNVVPPAGEDEDYFLPWSIGDENYDRMTAAYNYLRNYYGYRELEYVGTDTEAYVYIDHDPLSNEIKDGSMEYKIVNDVIGGLTNNSTGGYYLGHFATGGMPNDSSVYYNAVELYYGLNDYGYWYTCQPFTPRIPTQHTSNEFFAECFDNNVQGVDMEPTRVIFENSCDHYDNLIDDIYHDIKKDTD